MMMMMMSYNNEVKVDCTSYSDALVLVSGVPGLEFARLAAVVDLLTPGTSRQPYAHRPTALVAVFEQRFPESFNGQIPEGQKSD